MNTAAANGVLLEIEKLSKSFGGIRAVHDCSFAVRQGQVLGLIGLLIILMLKFRPQGIFAERGTTR